MRNPTDPRGLVTVVHLRPRLTSTLEASLSLGVVMNLEARTINISRISRADQPQFRSAAQYFYLAAAQYFYLAGFGIFQTCFGKFPHVEEFPKGIFPIRISQMYNFFQTFS